MAINNANLVFNGVTDEGSVTSGYSTFNGRYQWEYTDLTQTLVELDNETATGTAAERLRRGDLVNVEGSDGVGLYVVGGTMAGGMRIELVSRALAQGVWI